MSPRLNAGDVVVRIGAEQRVEAHPPPANVHAPLVEGSSTRCDAGRDPAVDGEVGRAVAAYRTRSMLTRRQFVEALGASGAAIGLSGVAAAQAPQAPPGPPSTVTKPPRDFGPGAPPTTYFTDPDVLTVDPLFDGTLRRTPR